MIALAALIGLAVGAAAVWLYRGEQVRDARADATTANKRADHWRAAYLDALPRDHYAELMAQTEAEMAAVPMDPTFDAHFDLAFGGRP